MTTAELYVKLIEKFGTAHQTAVAIEELAELAKELTKALRGKSNDMRIAEEIADVTICIEQLSRMYNVKEGMVDLFRKFKLDRLEQFYVEGEHK
jgi:NTP pyrophosphatase (non-canonical NTP hydrolase)